ncbi:MAG TPA: electron transport complex subunit RsxG [Candidatus Competibacteraceae bacterium]|nr:electron transport complex subunit RsxG [Candidatus Competibacteraceae bacterium]
MHPTLRNMLTAGGILTGFALAGTALVVVTYQQTHPIVAENARRALLANLNELVPAERYDNDLTADTLEIRDPAAFGTEQPVTVYRAYRNGQPVALLATLVAPDGYSGAIRLLVAVNADGTLAGVRVLGHKETPGLGDKIEAGRSDWILGFTGKSLSDPAEGGWKVKKDGGQFDQFTGATITPRAVVGAVRRFLVYLREHREVLFQRSPDRERSPPGGIQR